MLVFCPAFFQKSGWGSGRSPEKKIVKKIVKEFLEIFPKKKFLTTIKNFLRMILLDLSAAGSPARGTFYFLLLRAKNPAKLCGVFFVCYFFPAFVPQFCALLFAFVFISSANSVLCLFVFAVSFCFLLLILFYLPSSSVFQRRW